MSQTPYLVRNQLLRALSDVAFGHLAPHLKLVSMAPGVPVFEPGKRMESVLFPESGLASVVRSSPGSRDVEIGLIGPEGFAGYHVVLGIDRAPYTTVMQIGGEALVLDVAILPQLMATAPGFGPLLLRYLHIRELQLSQSVVSASSCRLGSRLASWLLMCHDRLDTDDLPVTHEFLAVALGVRRAGVTNELHILEGERAIKATRGNVRILSRDILMKVAGGAYGFPEAEYRRLIGPPVAGTRVIHDLLREK